MAAATITGRTGVIGRERELAALDEFLALDAEVAALVLVGDPGIGKTTLWEQGGERAESAGYRLLRARPSETEKQLSFAVLADLLEDVDDSMLELLVEPQRRALEVALLRIEPGDAPPTLRAIAAGVLAVLRALAKRAPLLLAIDDVPWMDAASAQALAFAARRLRLDRARFLLARREGDASPFERAFPPAELARLQLDGLSFGALQTVLARRGQSLPRRVLRRVFDSSGGNPLYALELARMLGERGIPEVSDELPDSEVIQGLMGAHVEGLPPNVRALLVTVALAPGLSRSDLESLAEAGAVSEAVELGSLIVDGERVRAAHPLLAAAARGSAKPNERLALHLELAEVVEDEELRARHMALGTDRPDEGLAARIARAANRAGARGAAVDAAELAGHALRLTPRTSSARAERVLELGERLLVAGERERASELLKSEFDTLPSGPARARAHLLIAETNFALVHVADTGAHVQAALRESVADPVLHAKCLGYWSRHLLAGVVERIDEAERTVVEALTAVGGADSGVERSLLHVLAFARKLRGAPIDDVRDRFDAVSTEAFHLQWGVERFFAERLGTRGELREARALFRRLLAVADERGEAWSWVWIVFQLCELELRAGEWDAAARFLDESAETPDLVLMDTYGYERCRALLAAGRGHHAEAEQIASRTIEVCEERGLRWNHLEALRARGIAAVLARDLDRAVESLAAVWHHTEQAGVDEPAEFPVAPDLVEALVELGRFGEAEAVNERLRNLATDQEHPWGLATADRCDALLRLASARDESALALLEEAAAEYLRLGLRFDHARTLLAAGRAARRLRKWSAARGLLEAAAAAFDAIGSDGWADEARAELGRIAARRPTASGELTPSEKRVAELAVEGLGNKEIARTLSVTVHTVEVHLSHAYAKLGIRSRSQLAESLRVSVI